MSEVQRAAQQGQQDDLYSAGDASLNRCRAGGRPNRPISGHRYTRGLAAWRCPNSVVFVLFPFGGIHASGEVLVPTLSVVSSGTRHPFRNRLSILNQPIISTIFLEIVSPYLSRSSRKVSSRNVPVFDNSSVALHTRTYSGLIPDTGPSVAAASISAADRPAFLAMTTLARAS